MGANTQPKLLWHNPRSRELLPWAYVLVIIKKGTHFVVYSDILALSTYFISMRNIWLISAAICLLFDAAFSQAHYPIIKDFGGIYKIDDATVLPDSTLDYQIVIDVYSGPETQDQLNPALNNVARMLNLHAVGGVAAKNMHVVLAIHGDATVAVMDDEHYMEEFKIANPNTHLIEALAEAGVKLTVCGQSLIGRDLNNQSVLKQVEIATSMLTTVTTYQMKGYAFLRF